MANGDAAHVLRQARMRAGLSQAEVAARAGTSQPAISMYESGAREPTVATLRRLVEASGARLRLDAVPHRSADLTPPADVEEHARRRRTFRT
ncbi:MAG TPA: helix-turn-helix transcriptional regulator [Acidimicrobiales bacterium]|nr:helix-turn-helix transcriptional regulator [Acidimicrobiales bacterium]